MLMNNEKDTQSISPSAIFVAESIHSKKFKNPLLFEVKYYHIK
jgi:hypothetical protein